MWAKEGMSEQIVERQQRSRRGLAGGIIGDGQDRINRADVGNIALDDGELAGIEPNPVAMLTGVDDGVAAAEIRMCRQPAGAARAAEPALEVGRIEGLVDLFVGAVQRRRLWMMRPKTSVAQRKPRQV